MLITLLVQARGRKIPARLIDYPFAVPFSGTIATSYKHRPRNSAPLRERETMGNPFVWPLPSSITLDAPNKVT
jgi:hypothetical protein